MARIRDHVLASHDAAQVTDIDGIRLRTDKGWWLVRASNTEAALVARAEAENMTDLKDLKDELSAVLQAAGLDGLAD